MNKNVILIGTVVFSLIAIGLTYFLWESIQKPIREAKFVADTEERVIARMKLIREAQKLYLTVKGKYADNFTDLIAFIKDEKLAIVNEKEIVIKGDEFKRQIDTIGYVAVRDSLLPKAKYPNFIIDSIAFIPNDQKATKDRFAMATATSRAATASFVNAKEGDKNKEENSLAGLLQHLEVKDVAPVNPARRRKGPEALPHLGFGSLTDLSLKGNWGE